jgi:hypothetical protein
LKESCCLVIFLFLMFCIGFCTFEANLLVGSFNHLLSCSSSISDVQAGLHNTGRVEVECLPTGLGV